MVGPAPASGGISTGGDLTPSRLLVLVKNGWARGASYRVRLVPSLEVELGRRFGRSERLEWRIPEGDAGNPNPAVAFDKRLPLSYETWEAASSAVDGRFPGGQTLLFQGLWTDPVTGIAYARARWYDARNAVWLSEDPLGAIDSPNLYAFVGLQPNMAVDPMGLECFGISGTEDCTDLERSAEFAKGEAKGLAKGLYNAGKGLVDLAVGVVKLTVESVTDPVGTARRVKTKAENFVANIDKLPRAVGEALVNGFDAFVDAKPEQQSEIFGEQVLTPILLGKFGETAEAEKLSGAARVLTNKGLSKAYDLAQEGLQAWTARREARALERAAESGNGIRLAVEEATVAASKESRVAQPKESGWSPPCPTGKIGANCIAAGTLVSTAGGLKQIEKIQGWRRGLRLR